MITSRQNAGVREVREALRKRPPHAFVAEGPNIIGEALAAGVSLSLLLVTPGARGPVVEQARQQAQRALEVSDEILAYAADSQHPQGIVALAAVPSLPVNEARARAGRLLLLDEVRDPGNLGTIVRTAWAADVTAVLLAGQCVDPWSPKVVRAAAGALFHVPVLVFPHRPEAGAWLNERGQHIFMATAEGRLSCFEAPLAPPITLVLGNEAHGVHADTAAFCHDSLRVPMAAGCESLNLAATAAILCYLSVDREGVDRERDLRTS